MKNVAILYHFPCPDGVFASLAAYLRFHNDKDINNLFFVPHSTIKLLNLEEYPYLNDMNTTAYLLDYCGPEGFIPLLAKRVHKVILIDHHKTALEMYSYINNKEGNIEINIAMEKSGATLALDYFSKERDLFSGDEKLRERSTNVYKYIEDHDLYKHLLPLSKEFTVGLSNQEINFEANENPSLWDQLLAVEIDAMIELGKKKIDEQNAIIESELATSFAINLGANIEQYGSCLAVHTNYPQFRSDLGNVLSKKSSESGLRAIGCVVYSSEASVEIPPNVLKVSLRSIGDEDTTVISKAFGGGGHKNASSFMLEAPVFETWKKMK
eukprot:TRINITY_DN3301_c0_g1_i7.p1 TRINITY_DN3301_c0_g1~~TRINITY_DN3301_c0_g1_i7.p1  ORF type:complete len:325 (+),score=71.20 TRINITY_DN3301_c0_g1_i7:314-1288(+)